MIEPNNLFQLQTRLIDSKVDMAVSTAIEKVVEQIRSLKDEMGNLRHEMHVEIGGLYKEIGKVRFEMTTQFSSLSERAKAIETRLGMVTETKKAFFDRTVDYLFKTIWWLFAGALPYLLFQSTHIIK